MKALITGITGQDGAYLAKFLLKKGYQVFGTYRNPSSQNFWRLKYLGIQDKIELVVVDIVDSTSIAKSLSKLDPHEFYHLATPSSVSASFDQPLQTLDITGSSTLRILEEIRKHNEKIKFYNAASSEMYGSEKSPIKNENSAFHPSSPYAIAKLYSHWTVNMYRHAYNMFAVSGILFNHESPLRGLEFVTRRISNGVAKIALGISKELKLGNLNARRDWGYAPEYVEGMWKMMQQKNPDDYVLATNESHSIKEFVQETCHVAGISPKCIVSSKENFRPLDIQNMQGDYTKAKKKLDWQPKTKFKDLVKIMVKEDILRWEKWQKKEYFPWDASTSGQDSQVFKKLRQSP